MGRLVVDYSPIRDRNFYLAFRGQDSRILLFSSYLFVSEELFSDFFITFHGWKWKNFYFLPSFYLSVSEESLRVHVCVWQVRDWNWGLVEEKEKKIEGTLYLNVILNIFIPSVNI